ncbi:hypothetical protein Dtox_1636 [Desulfofarcimen acetoxidans DSM 771]|uniref:Zinc-ribbon domain-containing protein n=1 Tax=Desulfofarcimen acetoxidans (strain ATCC 49208 / DSM 771 / KCTC 5769 / VKM B-1644 / 5575) TaxID=485916 RepID=C8VWE1_DESAS|nr:zinc ribbon domain-containing protein [Desulfofarcimen acetoxidans]ACV62493.1 hypothetical protein Dtox_1636 [Desulfofarcimen acetoxidans DSM 771]
MSIFDKFSEGAKNITEGAKLIGKKSGEILETTKTRLEILKLEKEIDNNFQAIGSLVYKKFLGQEIPDSEEEITRLCSSIRDLEKDIMAYKTEIEGNRFQNQVCRYCGQNITAGANFCSSCGNSTKTPVDGFDE